MAIRENFSLQVKSVLFYGGCQQEFKRGKNVLMKKPVKKKLDPDAHRKAMEEFGKTQRQREQGYRARALKMYPHICASCGREFSGRQLSELTVHHKDQ